MRHRTATSLPASTKKLAVYSRAALKHFAQASLRPPFPFSTLPPQRVQQQVLADRAPTNLYICDQLPLLPKKGDPTCPKKMASIRIHIVNDENNAYTVDGKKQVPPLLPSALLPKPPCPTAPPALTAFCPSTSSSQLFSSGAAWASSGCSPSLPHAQHSQEDSHYRLMQGCGAGQRQEAGLLNQGGQLGGQHGGQQQRCCGRKKGILPPAHPMCARTVICMDTWPPH